MEERISKLKYDFNNVMKIRNTVKNIFEILQIRIDKLKSFYSEFIKVNQKQIFVFGLDSLRFQSKLIDIEYDDMKRLFLAINNRMYCEYFKLYKIVVEYILENVQDKKVAEIIKVNNFPVYKDLEPFKEYKFEFILEIHENILVLVSTIISYLNTKENELTTYKCKNKLGLNIDNFVTSFNYEIIMIREKVLMFLTYIEFFHKLHTKYLKRFSNKIHLMYTHINNDIDFDESLKAENDKRKTTLDSNDDDSICNNIVNDSILYSIDTPRKILNNTTITDDASHNNLKKISSLLQLSLNNKGQSIIMSENEIHNNVLDSFLNINMSCDNIINGEYTPTKNYIEPDALTILGDEMNSPLETSTNDEDLINIHTPNISNIIEPSNISNDPLIEIHMQSPE